MTLLAIQPHPKRRHYYTLVLDRREPLLVHEDVIVALGLRPGQQTTPELLQAIAHEQMVSEAREAALRLLKVRARSRQELIRRLTQKGYTDAVVAESVAKLENLGLVNDVQFARDLTCSLLRRQSLSRRGLLHRLRAGGVTPQVAERVVSELLEGADEAERATRALRERLPRWAELSTEKRRAKAYQYLARLGFEAEAISDALSATLTDD